MRHQILFYAYGPEGNHISAVNVSIKNESVDYLKQAVVGLIEANNRCHYIRSVELNNFGITNFFDIKQVTNFADFSDQNKEFVRTCAIVPYGMENNFMIEEDSIYVKSVKIIRNSNIKLFDSYDTTKSIVFHDFVSLEFELDVYEPLVDEESESYFHFNEKFVLKID